MESADDTPSEQAGDALDWTFDEIADAVRDDYLPDWFSGKIKMYKRGMYNNVPTALVSVERANPAIDIFSNLSEKIAPDDYTPAPQDRLFHIDINRIEAINHLEYDEIITDHYEFMRQQTMSNRQKIMKLRFMFYKDYRYTLLVNFYHILQASYLKHRVVRGSDGKIGFEKVESL